MNVNGKYTSIEQITGAYLNNQNKVVGTNKYSTVPESKVNKNEDGASFQEIYKTVKNPLKFSKHAGERLASRNINLTDSQIERLNEGARKAEKKGIQESLVIMDNMAFIVNVKNSTVITAMDQSENNENVFTNIDGAVII